MESASFKGLSLEQLAEIEAMLRSAKREVKGTARRKESLACRYLRRAVVALRKVDESLTDESALSFILSEFRENEFAVTTEEVTNKETGETSSVLKVKKVKDTDEEDTDEEDTDEEDTSE